MRTAFTIGLCCCLVLANAAGRGAEPRDREAAAYFAAMNAAQARMQALRQSLEATSPTAWTGEYYEGDHLGFNLYLIITRDRFAYAAYSDIGFLGAGHGTVAQIGNRIRLNLAPENNNQGSAKGMMRGKFDTDLVPVQWGSRRYLVAVDEFANFGSAINHGSEPGSPGLFLLRKGDEKKPVAGLTGLPDGIRDFVLGKQIVMQVVGESELPARRVKPEYADFLPNTRYQLVFDKGSRNGVKVGLEVWQCYPSSEFALVVIDRVEAYRSFGVLTPLVKNEPAPTRQWRFTTGQYPNARSCPCDPPAARATAGTR
jgi:hypothetical protein